MKTKDWEKEFDKQSDFGFEWFISPKHHKKAKEFIKQFLSQQKQEMVGEVEKEIRLQSIWFDGSDTEYGMGWNGCLEQLNKQLKQNLTK